MNCSDWISIICAGVSLVVTIIMACLQFWQSSRINKFERRQDERDEQRHAESVKAQAVSFISKHYSNRGLIPLCAIAAMHNDLFYYSREMYREFCCMTLEVQNRILEYCELDLRVRNINGLFDQCIQAVENVIDEHFPDDRSPFYDGGKYVLRSLENYGTKKIPEERIKYNPSCMDMDSVFSRIFASGFDGTLSYESCISDVLDESFRGEGTQQPIAQLEQICKFNEAPEINACQFVTILAMYIAIYAGNNIDSDKDYGTPGGHAKETIDTMEDLFLESIFEIYTCLILNHIE